MILADKIVTLRKRAGWSQEELAEQLGVSRQSVSKWEGAQSVPDMQKVVQMSRLFGVTTDYLLKEELGEPEPAPAESDAPLRRVTMEQAADYLAQRQAAAPKLALATLLCVLSPVALLLLAALSDRPGAALSENAAAGIGLCVLLVLVAAAVAVFITCAAQVKAYAFLESEPFETAYGVTGMVRGRRAAFAPRHTRGKVVGTVLCILSAVPLFIAVCLDGSDLLYVGAVCLLLVLAVKALVVKAAVLLVLCGFAVIELLIRFRLRGQGSAAAAAGLFAAQRALPAAGAGAQFGILIREMPLVPGCMGGAVDAAAQLFVAGTVIGGTAVRADHDVIFQGQRLTAALAGTAIIFRHVFLQ